MSKDYENHLIDTINEQVEILGKKKELLVEIYKMELVQNQIIGFKDMLKEEATYTKDSADEVHGRKEIVKLKLILSELMKEHKESIMNEKLIKKNMKWTRTDILEQDDLDLGRKIDSRFTKKEQKV